MVKFFFCLIKYQKGISRCFNKYSVAGQGQIEQTKTLDVLQKLLYQTYDYIDSSGRIFEDTKNIFLDDTKKEIREKLQRSFGYTNISRASLFQEEKYMNLWVVLESLARTGMYSDIITNVKATVPTAVSIRYIYRIVRNYVEDCIRCRVKFEFSTNSMC